MNLRSYHLERNHGNGGLRKPGFSHTYDRSGVMLRMRQDNLVSGHLASLSV